MDRNRASSGTRLDLIEADIEAHRCGEAAQQRWCRRRRYIKEGEGLFVPRHFDQAIAKLRPVGKQERKIVAVGSEQSELERDRHRLLAALPRRGRHYLIDGELGLL